MNNVFGFIWTVFFYILYITIVVVWMVLGTLIRLTGKRNYNRVGEYLLGIPETLTFMYYPNKFKNV